MSKWDARDVTPKQAEGREFRGTCQPYSPKDDSGFARSHISNMICPESELKDRVPCLELL